MAKGWFYESYRHSLAAKGIRTGRKIDKPIKDVWLIKKYDEYIEYTKYFDGTRVSILILPDKKSNDYYASFLAAPYSLVKISLNEQGKYTIRGKTPKETFKRAKKITEKYFEFLSKAENALLRAKV